MQSQRALLLAFVLQAATHPLLADGASRRSLLFHDDFSSYANGLVTNEFAFENPAKPQRRSCPNWEVTSGSLFAADGAAFTGVPDRESPNADSSDGNDSAVFRCRTRASNFGDVQFSVSIFNEGFVAPPKSPAKGYDGIHLWLRYVSDKSLYSVTVNRRDNLAIIKKKVPGGPSNGGTYTTLKSVPFAFPMRAWQHFTAQVTDTADGKVALALQCEGKPVLAVVDDGTKGGPPITGAGRVGVRGDNCQFKFDDVEVRPVSP